MAGQQLGLTPEYAAELAGLTGPSDRAAEEEAEPGEQTSLKALQAEASTVQQEEEAQMSLPPGLEEEPPGAAHPAMQVRSQSSGTLAHTSEAYYNTLPRRPRWWSC